MSSFFSVEQLQQVRIKAGNKKAFKQINSIIQPGRFEVLFTNVAKKPLEKQQQQQEEKEKQNSFTWIELSGLKSCHYIITSDKQKHIPINGQISFRNMEPSQMFACTLTNQDSMVAIIYIMSVSSVSGY